jgi:hypothetical protein
MMAHQVAQQMTASVIIVMREEHAIVDDLFTLLSPEGTLTDGAGHSADLPGMFRDMVMSRRIDTEAIALQRRRCSARRPHRSVPGAPSGRGTSPSRRTASTVSRGAGGSTP